MQALSEFLDNFPVVTFGVVVIIIVAAVKSITGDLSYDEFLDTVVKTGIGGGAIGGARALSRLQYPPSR